MKQKSRRDKSAADFSYEANPVYLRDIPREQAQRRFRQSLQGAGLWRVLGTEVIALDEAAVGRVTAAPVWARISSPHYHAAAMDGFAVRAETTASAQYATPLTIDVMTDGPSRKGPRAIYVDTGDALPDWADAVVPLEHVEALDRDGGAAVKVRSPHQIRVRAGVPPWAYVRPMGEDLVTSELVLPAGHVLRPFDLGAAAAAGHSTVVVARRPRVAIIPTGSELQPVGSTPAPGAILEYNSIVMAAQIDAMGGNAIRFAIVEDDPELIARAVARAAVDCDLLLINAGSSAGSEDFSAAVVGRLGDLLVHGVAVRPGHPVILGLLRADIGGEHPPRAVVGVPGYPVSAALTIEIFVEPLLAAWLGRQSREYPEVTAQLTRKIASPAGDEDFVRVAVGRVGPTLLAAPLASGAGVISSLARADGVVIIPPGVQGVETGESIRVRLYRNATELDRTIVCVGSHDITIDLLAQFLQGLGRRLVSANVGSQGGLVALRRKHAHLAGCHLLDPTTGEYNRSYIRKYLGGLSVKAVALALREQGLIVGAGNPKVILGIDDLKRSDVMFVNRQRGAGTRLLLDHHLTRAEVAPGSVQGYDHEEFTHLGVAVAVSSGRADCGLGIAAAASALGLDFVPLFKERFDLIMLREHADSSLLEPLLELLASDEFRGEVARLPGYDTSVMGDVILED